jgi:hypothetical protein
MTAASEAIFETLIEWGYHPPPRLRQRTAKQMLDWFRAVLDQELQTLKKKVAASVAAGRLPRNKARPALMQGKRQGDVRFESLRRIGQDADDAASAQAAAESSAGAYARAQQQPDYFSSALPEIQQGRAALTDAAAGSNLFNATSKPPMGARTVSPIPSTPDQIHLTEIEWLDKSRNAWASMEEIDAALATGDFSNLSPVTQDDVLLTIEPPETYDGPSGIIDLDDVRTAMLFDGGGNVYYLPVANDRLILAYFGVSQPGSGSLLIPIAIIAGLFFIAKR